MFRRATIILAVIAMLTFVAALPALAYSWQQLERNCYTTLVGIDSKTTGVTTHYEYWGGEVNPTASWNNGASNLERWSIANHYHLYDSAGFGSRVDYSGTADWAYNYCSVFS